MQKLARAVIGTNNMDNCSRYCQGGHEGCSHGGLRRRFRFHRDMRTRSGHNYWRKSAEAHPVCTCQTSAKLRGQKLIVADCAR